MSKLEYKTQIHFPKECSDPIGEVAIFLRVNGYKSNIESDKIHATRGEKGKGFWTSDLTVLPTSLQIELINGQIRLVYEVDTSGQILNDVEKLFWKREGNAIQSFLHGEKVENFVESEKEKAGEIRSDFLKKGLYYGLAAAFFLFFIIMILMRVL